MHMKTIGVEIPTQLEPELDRSGLHTQDFVQALIDDAARQVSNADSERSAAAVRAMLQFAAKHGAKLGGLNLKELAHEGHRF
jgi:uncharacterized protein with PIN domain